MRVLRRVAGWPQMVRSGLARPHRVPNYLFAIVLACILANFILMVPIGGRGACLSVYANQDHAVITDWCYRIPITVTNSGSSVTTVPIAVTGLNFGSLTNALLLNSHGWDLRPVNPTLNPIEAVIQDVAANNATGWVIFPTIGTSARAYLYMGNAYTTRDQGFYFDGVTDTVTATAHADFDLQDDLGIDIDVETASTTQDAWLVEKYTEASSTGYRVGVSVSGTTQVLRAQVDNQALNVVFDGDEKVRVTFANPTLTILYRNDTTNVYDSQGTLATGLSQVSTTTANVIMGRNYEGTIRDAIIRSGEGTANVARVAKWGFNAEDITQTQAGTAANSWVWTGTVTDEAVGHNGTYSLTRNMANYTVTVGALATTLASEALTVQERFSTFLGTPVAVDPFNPTNIATNIPMYDAFNSAITATGLPGIAFWFLIVASTSVALMSLVYIFSRQYAFAGAVPTVGFTMASVVGVLPAYIAILIGFTTVGIFMMGKWGR